VVIALVEMYFLKEKNDFIRAGIMVDFVKKDYSELNLFFAYKNSQTFD